MTVRNISVEAYRKHMASGRGITQWMQAFQFLQYYPKGLTRNELADISGIRITSICGRVNEMMKAGLVVECPRRPCKVTQEPAHPVKVVKLLDGHTRDEQQGNLEL